MSKIIVEFDTKSKELLLSRDGTELDVKELGLEEIGFFTTFDQDKFGMRMSHFQKDDEEDIRTTTFMSAKEIAEVIHNVDI